MKILTLCFAALGLLGAQAVDPAGTWQGTLMAGPQQLRTIVKLDRKDGALGGVLYSIDQSPNPIPLSKITLENSTLKFAIPAIGGSYEGKMAADGKSVTGAAVQGPNSMPLNLVRATPDIAWTIPEPPPPPVQIAANKVIHVEVATVKPSAPGGQGRLYTFRGDRVQAINVSVVNLLTFSYDLHDRQVAGLPSWASDEKFEIVIKPDTAGQPNLAQMKQLFKEVLADRFQLKTHVEKRQLSAYAITLVAGKPHKLTKSTTQGDLPSLLYPGLGMLPARNATMVELAQSMQNAVLDRPVVDRTGIEGRYDFTLDWMPDETQFASFGPRGPAPDNGKPNIFQAFQDELGLKLEGVQAPIDVYVTDKVERPSDN